jgi:muramidase (phage lysozyme)
MKAALAVTILAAAAIATYAIVHASSAEADGQGEAMSQDSGNVFSEVIGNATSSPTDTAHANVQAFLKLIRTCEGTDKTGNPYAVVYGYEFTITDFSDHPAALGWKGGKLPDGMCRAAGLSAGCVSTAAGAYQFIKPTWRSMGQPDFTPESQDAACIKLLTRLGALSDIQSGDITAATAKCARTWASLPGNSYKQGAKSIEQVAAIFQAAGGTIA